VSDPGAFSGREALNRGVALGACAGAGRAATLPFMPLVARWICLGVVVVVAAWLRVHDLGNRPMHADEANQAVKLGALLERGEYRFDPYDHHGPTLYYLGLIPAWVRGERTLAELTETTVRMTPALAGTAAVLLLALTAAPLGWPVALVAAALLAVSPAAVYYSRYFVQETLLVAFALLVWVAASRWMTGRRWRWALIAGGALGLMQATKATAPLFVAMAVVAWLAGRWAGRRGPGEPTAGDPRVGRGSIAVALLVVAALAIAVAALFYSSFFSHPAGLRDAVATYLPMSGRVAASGGAHDKPWWYYASLFWRQQVGGYTWDQTPFLVLVVAGGVGALISREGRWRSVAVYALGVAAVLSAVPYKTPWVVVNLLPAMAVLAAWVPWRVAALGRWGQALAAVGVGFVIIWQAGQVRQAVFRRPADPRNPLAYVHSSPDVRRAALLAKQAGEGPVRVISEEYWPLPWYLRDRDNVGYWTTVPAECDGSLLFVSPALAESVRERLRGNYEEGFIGLRPGYVLQVFRRVPESASGEPGLPRN